jgi:hypothetical protein
MLGVDTNVIVRYLTRDDQQQYQRARRLINFEVVKGEPVLVSLLVEGFRGGFCGLLDRSSQPQAGLPRDRNLR